MDNSDIKNKLLELLNYMGDRTLALEGFAIDQLPLVAREIVAWSFWTSIITIVVTTLIISLLVFLIKLANADIEKQSKEDKETTGWVTLIGGFAILFFCGIFIMGGVVPALKSIVAPRLVIIEYVKSELRNFK